LQENKDKIASLQRAAAQLRKANLRIDGLEKMIADLNKQLAGKKDEIARLRETSEIMKLRASLAQEPGQDGCRGGGSDRTSRRAECPGGKPE
jgi:predicted RNase H-like nuclease (RuvC/YqgF family)